MGLSSNFFQNLLQDEVNLGELMVCLCFLPKAGRLTITIIKGRNFKAMDITGKSGTAKKNLYGQFVCTVNPYRSVRESLSDLEREENQEKENDRSLQHFISGLQ